MVAMVVLLIVMIVKMVFLMAMVVFLMIRMALFKSQRLSIGFVSGSQDDIFGGLIMVVVLPFSRTYYVFLPIIVPRTEVQKLVTNYKETMKCDGYKSKMDRCLSERIDLCCWWP